MAVEHEIFIDFMAVGDTTERDELYNAFCEKYLYKVPMDTYPREHKCVTNGKTLVFRTVASGKTSNILWLLGKDTKLINPTCYGADYRVMYLGEPVEIKHGMTRCTWIKNLVP